MGRWPFEKDNRKIDCLSLDKSSKSKNLQRGLKHFWLSPQCTFTSLICAEEFMHLVFNSLSVTSTCSLNTSSQLVHACFCVSWSSFCIGASGQTLSIHYQNPINIFPVLESIRHFPNRCLPVSKSIVAP